MATVTSLNVKLGADTGQFNRSMGAARRTISSMTGAVIGLAGSVGFGALIKSSLDSADRIQKLRDATGLSSEFLSEMRFVASQTGTDLETVTKSVSKMQRSINDANIGLKTQVRNFEALGVPIKALAQLNPEEQFSVILDAISRVNDETVRAAVGQQIFGRSFAALGQLSRVGASGLAELREKARAANQTLTDGQVDAAAAANDAIDSLTRTWSGLTQQLALRFAPAIRGAVLIIGDVLPRAIENIQRGIRGIGTAVGASVASLEQLFRGNFRGAFQTGLEGLADARAQFAGQGAATTERTTETERQALEVQKAQLRKQDQLITIIRGGVPVTAQ